MLPSKDHLIVQRERLSQRRFYVVDLVAIELGLAIGGPRRQAADGEVPGGERLRGLRRLLEMELLLSGASAQHLLDRLLSEMKSLSLARPEMIRNKLSQKIQMGNKSQKQQTKRNAPFFQI